MKKTKKIIDPKTINTLPKLKDSIIRKFTAKTNPFLFRNRKSGLIKAFFKKKEYRKDPQKFYLVNMEMSNGHHDYFSVDSEEPYFTYKNGNYILGDVASDARYFVITSDAWCLDYHQECCLPIKRKIPLTAIKKAFESISDNDIINALNPFGLRRFLENQVIEAIFKGNELNNKLSMLIFIAVATLIGVVVCGVMLYMVLKKLGVVNL